MKSEVWLVVAPVQVVSRHRCPVVTNYDSVGVYHRNHFEDDALPQLPGLVAAASYILQESLHHPAAVRLSWVDSRSNYHEFLPFIERERQLARLVAEFLHVYVLVVVWV